MWVICFIVVEVIMFFVPIPRAVAIERNLIQYSSGKPCKHGNIHNRRVKGNACVCEDCLSVVRKRSSTWLANPKNTETARKRARKYYVDNTEQVLIQRKKYYAENKDEVLSKNRNWVLKNKIKSNLISSNWRKRNPHNSYIRCSNRRAAKINATLSLNKELTSFILSEIFELRKLRKKSLNISWDMDHMIPLQCETVCGLHVWNNFQCLPSVMNSSKQNSLIYTNPHEWLYDIPKFFKVVYQQEIAA